MRMVSALFARRRNRYPLWLLLAWLPLTAAAGMPQPMVVFYGQARDQFGWPYRSGATVIMRSGTNEITRQTINGSLAPGINFTLYVPIDDGRSTRLYDRTALVTGTVVNIVVADSRGETVIMESTALPPLSQPGDIVRMNITAAVDADGDGIPDEWELELIRWANDPAFTSIHDIHPHDDFDDDGVSNIDEYRAGTFAFLDYDYFMTEYFERVANNRFMIDFLSVPGKSYTIEQADAALNNSGQFDWNAAPFALDVWGEYRGGHVDGTGGWMAFYVSTTNAPGVWRLRVE
jgi:hypothetical protein